MSQEHHRKQLSREDQAKAEIGITDMSRPVAWFLTILFVALIYGVPLHQTLRDVFGARPQKTHPAPEKTGTAAWGRPQCFDVVHLVPSRAEIKGVFRSRSLGEAFGEAQKCNDRILRDIKSYETRLKDEACLTALAVPHMQTIITGLLRGGNEDVYCGRGGWLFFRPEIDALTAPGFLEPSVLRGRAWSNGREIQPDPRLAILQFRDQLKSRGIDLIVLPMPSKAVIHPEHFSSRYDDYAVPLQNPSFRAFLEELAAKGVLVFDPAPALVARKLQTRRPQWLQTDTHWTPDALEHVAELLKGFLLDRRLLPPAPPAGYVQTATAVTGQGDLALMLRLPPGQAFFPPQSVTVHAVSAKKEPGGPWEPDPAADVLLLGDSYSNIYSLSQMNWGASAGFAEQISHALQRPVDRIVRNDSGAFATREMLYKDNLAKGRDRLAGKKVVIWEFAVRELSTGDWKLLEVPAAPPASRRHPGRQDAGAAAAELVLEGTIQAASPVPLPRTVPYKDHIRALHVTGVKAVQGDHPEPDVVVYLWSMRDNEWTPAARLAAGDRVTLRLCPWAKVAAQYESINRTELDDPDLQLREPFWVVETKGARSKEDR